jgi:peptidyl-prolyl cis-trans isomerase B (cyclophilin B)
MQCTNVELHTNLGIVTLELDVAKAPKTVENFLKYLDDGHYDGTLFHRVIDGFMVQGGGYDTRYEKKGVGEPIKNEADNGLKNRRGTVAMARTSDPDSATAQFFINVSDNAFLNHKGRNFSSWGYCVFGKVVEGMDVLDEMRAVETGPVGPFRKDAPLSELVINSVKRSN